MDLTPEAVYQAIFPTAAFAEPSPTLAHTHAETNLDGNPTAWDNSNLNPKNRIDSLEPFRCPKWRIDGCAGMGTQFYTIPLFLQPQIPMRIDTFIPPQSQYPPGLREVLEINAAFHYRDSRIADFGIARFILRGLEHWTSRHPDFKTFYESLPFGSHIVFENIAKDVREIRIQVVPTHYLERQLLSTESLQSMWERLFSPSWPPTLDISQVHLLRQLHDSTSLVEIPNSNGGKDIVILKALTNSPKYLYHELKLLLSMPPHPNIMRPPLHLITKLCRFGGKTGVIGFTTPYHAQETLRDILPLRRIHDTLRLTDQTKWARQVTEAVIHIRTVAKQFYSDLRLDNILLSEEDSVIMIDFEQRGIGSVFAAPEVNYLEYINSLASDQSLPDPVKNKYELLYKKYIKPYVPPSRDKYRNDTRGYCAPWLCLTPLEQESAEVYMLGRLLWCIFEGMSGPEPSITTSYLREPELEFPSFCKTSENIRALVERCTRGWKGSGVGIVRRGKKLVARGGVEMESAEMVKAKAVDWWKEELEDAEDFLEKRERRRLNGDEEDPFSRPRLQEVLQVLREFECSIQSTELSLS